MNSPNSKDDPQFPLSKAEVRGFKTGSVVLQFSLADTDGELGISGNGASTRYCPEQCPETAE